MMTDQTRHDRTSQSADAVGAVQRGATTKFAYDDWGRLAARAQGGYYAAEYGYRYGSRLHEATSNFPGEEDVTFEYRGDGRLHQRTTGASDTVYRYGMGWDPLVEEDGSGYVLGAWGMTPGGARGKKLAYMFGGLNGGAPIYAYHDQLGSIRRTRWTNKSSFGRDEFDPYGGLYATEGLAFLPRHFATHPEDPALQAYRAPYRNYSPAMARWMTRDPLGMVDGTNVYGYVGNDPIGDNDLQGLSPRDNLGSDISSLLRCIESFMGPVYVTSGKRPDDVGSAHETGDAIDIVNADKKDPDGLDSCEIKNSAKYCAEMLGLKGLRVCRSTAHGHIHIDLQHGSKGKNGKTKTSDCSKWGGYEDPCKCK
jgi:RHS repeat-associated protein